jgi:hypothetical protein
MYPTVFGGEALARGDIPCLLSIHPEQVPVAPAGTGVSGSIPDRMTVFRKKKRKYKDKTNMSKKDLILCCHFDSMVLFRFAHLTSVLSIG